MDIVKLSDTGRDVDADGNLIHRYVITVNVLDVQNSIDNGNNVMIYNEIINKVQDFFKERIISK